MLVDEAIIQIRAGNGGDGLVSFLRGKFQPKGGPDGGKGGNGGDLYLIGVEDISALNPYRFKKSFAAEDGQAGGKNKKTGKDGNDLVLKVPLGTVVRSGIETWEIKDTETKILIAKGGRGGRGNWYFRSATNQTPLQFEYGTYGQKKELQLELRLIADVGLIGLPSVGKSSLLNELTNASAKVAAYHFTTLEPNLGAMDGLILADLPGLIEGASKGKGLGIKFLKHIKRTRILVHLISAEASNPLKDYQAVRKELGDYDKELLTKKEIILITKSDLVTEKEIKKISDKIKIPKSKILTVSIYNYDEVQKLKEKLLKVTKIS